MRISDWSSDVCSSDLRLHEQGAQALAAFDLGADTRLGLLAEAGEHLELEELRIVEAHGPARVAQDAKLRLAADPAHARAHIDGGLVPLREQLRVENNLRSEEHTSELQSLMRISYSD